MSRIYDGISGNFGRFQKGERRSPETEFKPGQHWRPRRPHWSRKWLNKEYTIKGKSAAEIATNVGITEPGILYWLHKHNIPRRTMTKIRAIKYWGQTGQNNPMFGRKGIKNPNYVDGSSAERQRLYSRAVGRRFIKAVLIRDNYKCVRCFSHSKGPKSLHVHHIKPWAGNKALRFDTNNGITLCYGCHNWVHSNSNLNMQYLDNHSIKPNVKPIKMAKKRIRRDDLVYNVRRAKQLGSFFN